jgi:MYXO-CTERM domain-containing protein
MLISGLVAALALEPRPLAAVPPPSQPIFGGEDVAPGEWPAVVALDIDGYQCTGTLVTPSLVLTAAHCLVGGPPVGAIGVRRGEDVTFPGPAIAAVAYGFDPEYCPPTSCKADNHDYGYIVLATPQNDVGGFPRVIHDQDEWDRLMRVGRAVTVVGYGHDAVPLFGVKREAEVSISRFSRSGLEFEAGGMGHDTCVGDSGGPAFARLDSGEWLLVGITSRGYTCGEGGIYAAPLGGLCWLEQASTFDLRPTDCVACDCIDTDPARSDGCGCAAGSGGAPMLWIGALALWVRRRRLTRS